MGLLEEQAARNIANRIAIEKSMGKDISDESCLDMLEKAGRAAAMGEVRTWNGKDYIKTPKGWRPKPKGYKEGSDKKEGTESVDEKKVPSSIKIEQKTFHVKDGKIRASMYDKQSRISKLMKFAKENGLKVEWEEGQKKEQEESLVDMINRKLREGHAAVKDSMKDDAKKIVEGDKNRRKDSKVLKKEISSDVKKLNEMSDRLEDLEDLMYGDEDDEMGTLENQSEYGDEYEELDGKFQKLAKNLKTSIRKYMKDINPDWKEPADADVWDFIREFNKAKAGKSQS